MKIIAAMDPYRVIGNKNNIPWHYSEDFKFFKKMTIGNNLIMGRLTFESIGKPLPNRYTFVLTNDPEKLKLPKSSLYEYINLESIVNNIDVYKNHWVCGGAKIYQLMLPYCEEVYMTHIIEEFEGDSYMPEFEHLFPNYNTLKETKDFFIVNYSK